ncbi:MAG TPA: nuclear transport factor 2 family protein [Spongiibacteraceae bacterium]|jgi:hypothetical protein|nr:nuclear transport factor 2 family protein [Spongiibacteraceae bacterium]HUH37741.1 nuclear transport factor 2 family protein [Spongiibacteraceae bacterium]
MNQQQPIEYQLACTYAQIADDREFARMAEIMSADFKMRSAAYNFDSLADYIAGLEALRQFSATFHLVGNQVGQWSGETYRGQTWCTAMHLYEKDGVARKLDMGIRYDDYIAMVDGRFRYTRRDLNLIWTQDLPLHA